MLSDDIAARRALARSVAALMLFFGVLFVYVTPPYQAPDEMAHFSRLAMLAMGDLLPETKDGVEGVPLPQSLLRFERRHEYLKSDLDAKYDYKRVVGEIRARSNLKPRAFTPFPSQATSPVMFLPSLLGVGAGALLHTVSFAEPNAWNWATMQYFGRLGNLFVFALAIAGALIALPRFHAVVTFVALMPMTMFLSSSVQYDSMTLLACLGLFVVVVRRTVLPGDFPRGELALLGVSAFLLGHGKIVYVPLLLALLPALLSVSRRSGLIAFAVAVIAVVVGILGALVFLPLSGQPMDVAEQQVAFLLGDLANIPGLIWRTLGDRDGFYFRSLFGHFGWLDTAVPPSLLLLVWGLFLLALFNDSRGPVRPVGGWTRLAAFGGMVLSLVGIMLSLYIIWTSRQPDGVGSPIVIGVQGRYFIPFLPFVAVVVSFQLRRLAPRFAGAVPDLLPVQLTLQAAALAVVLFMLLIRFWI